LRSICCGAKPADLFDEANFTRAVHTIFLKKRSIFCVPSLKKWEFCVAVFFHSCEATSFDMLHEKIWMKALLNFEIYTKVSRIYLCMVCTLIQVFNQLLMANMKNGQQC
jgi:hypothetical protein